MSIKKEEKTNLKLFTLFFFFVLLKFNGKIVLESRTIGNMLSLLICFLSFFLFAYSFSIKDIALKTLSALAFGVFSLLSIPFIFLISVDLIDLINRDGEDLGFECIHKIPYEDSMIKVYRTNGGATTDFGIIVRKEKNVLPGILLVKEYLNMYHEDTVGIRIIDRNKLEISRPQMNDVVIMTVDL